MTPTETQQLIDKHLLPWIKDTTPEGPMLRERLATMLGEAIAARDKLWQDGAAVPCDLEAIIERHDLSMEPYSGTSVRPAVLEATEAMRRQLSAMTRARDEAVAAAHMIHEGNAK